jgi:hypothetical protein
MTVTTDDVSINGRGVVQGLNVSTTGAATRGPVNGSAAAFVLYDAVPRTEPPEVPVLFSEEFSSAHVVIDIDDNDDEVGLTVTVEAVPPTGDPYTVLASSSLTEVGRTILKIASGLSPVANAVANDILPPRWQVSVAHDADDPITYSISIMQAP